MRGAATAAMQDGGRGPTMSADELRKAIESTALRVHDRLVRIARSLGCNAHDAEDIAQEALLWLIGSDEASRILASPGLAYDWLRRNAVWRAMDHIRRGGKTKPLTIDVPAGEGDEWLEMVNLREIDEFLERLEDTLDDRGRLVVRAYRDDVDDLETARLLGLDTTDELRARLNVRQIRSRTFERMRDRAGEGHCDRLAGSLDDRERLVVRSRPWDGPGDEEVAGRLGIGLDDVRQVRSRAFERMLGASHEAGVALSDQELRVVWATFRSGEGDRTIAEGLGIAPEDLRPIRRRALEKVRGKFGR